ncbi:MAG: tRNA uridine-5-carboxymethylaminomethyl(34) synthesis GTPase MnmE, partial [Clostridia bacterium]|nr:tRNA uridine-5-carboxymethylaminomethyl(34) synthesis GTPase MnmE [Clostridia bacterium]
TLQNADRTIAAISTAYGESGIGIVRMSGPKAKAIAQRIFVPYRTSGSPQDPGKTSSEGFAFRDRYMHYGHIADPLSGETIDEVLCVFMRAPHTYTGEDLVEIQCHGSMASLRRILSLCLDSGAEMAERGEFTKLAFLNGRIDLAQAEAVIDVIRARTGRGLQTAVNQLEGKLSEKVKTLRKGLLDLLVLLTVNMDYPDEDVEEATYEKIAVFLKEAEQGIEALLAGADEGKILREGLSVAIIGKPNVGKSSLMNLFLGEHRSIVTDIPGTTRDTIEEQISLRGIPIRLTDTAGIRESKDVVEALGIDRSKEAFNKADLVLLLLDSSRPLSEEDILLMEAAAERPCIAVLNKTDLPACLSQEDVRKHLKTAQIVHASLLNDEGMEALKDAMEALISGGKVRREEDVLVSNTRHIQLLKNALSEVREALRMTRQNEAMDFIEVNANAAFQYLGEITGDTASGEIIDEVFERFCLGK